MRLLGFEISRTKAATPTMPANLGSVLDNPRQWLSIIREPFTGAWQRNMELRPETTLSYSAVFRCITLIASDIAKLKVKLVSLDRNGIWIETESAAFSPVLKKPNRFQTRIQFLENWMNSKLVHGNTYVLLERDNRGLVVRMYILDPGRTQPLVAPDGEVFYQLRRDNLSGVEAENVTVPASEIIHDRCNALFHPLVGLSPLFAAAVPAIQGLKIQNNSTQFFANGSNPGGILTAPGAISDETAKRLKDNWDSNYTGANVGKVAVLGDGLKYEPMIIKPIDAQLIDQLKWTAQMVCSAFGVPPYKAGVGDPPAYNNIEALARDYYSQCLQTHMEHLEECLDWGLGLDTKKEGIQYGTELDLDNLFRLDSATLMEAEARGVGAAILAPNESRLKFNLPPVPGGDSPLAQQQNYSLEALAKRDASADPFGTAKPAAPASEAEPPVDDTEDEDKQLDDFRVFQSARKKFHGCPEQRAA